MAQLRRAISDGHFFIMAGWSKGTQQIHEAGIAWLKEHQYRLPNRGGWVHLDQGDYRRLERLDHLYINNEEYDRSPTQVSNIPLAPPETVSYGPPLLLELADASQQAPHSLEWRLIIKLDEWDESARDVLIRERAAAVGYYANSETGEYFFSSLSLRQIGRADAWPEVAPKKKTICCIGKILKPFS